MLGRAFRCELRGGSGGGGLENTGWGFGYNEKTGSHTLSPSRRQAAATVRQTKRRNTLHEISTLPGDGASHPCITVGVLEEVGLSGLGGGGGALS